MIYVHYVATANGIKVVMALEEMGLAYDVIDYQLFAGTHLTPEFRKLNPNNRLPVIVDDDPAFGGGPLPVFESVAIVQYLAEKSGMFLPASPRDRIAASQWLVWQAAGWSPMNGQAHHFIRYAPEGQVYGVERYKREVVRLCNVLDYRLSEVEYLAGDYSIADISVWPWAMGLPLIGIDIAEFPAVSQWCDRIMQRPAVIRAISSEKTRPPAYLFEKRPQLSPEQWSNMFGDRVHDAAKSK
jgi:GSH-dependent disulfide-bond oxidoreductase